MKLISIMATVVAVTQSAIEAETAEKAAFGTDLAPNSAMSMIAHLHLEVGHQITLWYSERGGRRVVQFIARDKKAWWLK